jgi:hypothetical protein
LEKQLLAMSSEIQTHSLVAKLLEGIRRIRVLIKDENGPPTKKTVSEIDGTCEQLVSLSSRHPA